ncbi:MAG: hypothetical protein D6719_12545 [Candidatus Dadabacteria bacterium]|nr:MAG: hypothetical protein D6719_12545 [Candidatus Dadabacteria bacterium]
MFNDLKDLFSRRHNLRTDRTGKPIETDLLVSTLILLMEMANCDDEFAGEELQKIVSLFYREFGLEDHQTGELITIALTLRKEVEDIDKFINQINEHFDASQRTKLLSFIWGVLEADGKGDPREIELARNLRQRLNLSLEQAAHARELAAKKD